MFRARPFPPPCRSGAFRFVFILPFCCCRRGHRRHGTVSRSPSLLLLPSGPPPSWHRVSLARGLIGRTGARRRPSGWAPDGARVPVTSCGGPHHVPGPRLFAGRGIRSGPPAPASPAWSPAPAPRRRPRAVRPEPALPRLPPLRPPGWPRSVLSGGRSSTTPRYRTTPEGNPSCPPEPAHSPWGEARHGSKTADGSKTKKGKGKT